MKIAFSKQHIVLAAHLYLGSVFGVKQHAICGLYCPDVGSHSDHLPPRQPASDCHSGWDQDATATAPLAGLAIGGDQHAIMEHPDGQCAVIQSARLLGGVPVTHYSVTAPTPHDRADDQQKSNDPGHSSCDAHDTVSPQITTSVEDFRLGIF
jgi:hypothetical protein